MVFGDANFIEVLDGIGWLVYGMWICMSMSICNGFGINGVNGFVANRRILMKLNDLPFDFVTKMLILPISGN